jgi:hypothetical protein
MVKADVADGGVPGALGAVVSRLPARQLGVESSAQKQMKA